MAPGGIALLQMGGPRTPDDVRPFLERLFRDAEMIRFPSLLRALQPAFGRAVARARAPGVVEKYRGIGTPPSPPFLPETDVVRSRTGGSPLCATTDALAARLEKELATRGAWRPVAPCYRYVEPGPDAALDALARAGAEEALAVTLYPHWSGTTTGTSWNHFRAAAARRGVPARLVERWGLHPGYLDLAAADAQEALDRVPPEHRKEVRLIFSAHGIPLSYVKAGDPYPREVRRTAEALARRLTGYGGWDLCFQSRVGPMPWLEPYADQHIREHGKDWSAVVVVPLGFVSDHIETLYDCDTLYPEACRDARVPFYTRARMFNDRPGFASFLADLVEERA